MLGGGRVLAKWGLVLDGGVALILPVILTKVRIQGYARRRFWLWALTFVRVTKWGDEGVTRG